MPAAAIKKSNQKVLRENERKWGAPLMKAGWCILPATILANQRELGLKAIDVNIIMHLVSHWWFANRLPYPSKARLAACMSVHKSTIQRRIRKMQKDGLIQRIERKDGERGQMTNFYDLDGLIKRATPFAKAAAEQKVKAGGRDVKRHRSGQPDLKIVHSGGNPK
jgi:DNA-binding transcriptional regulator YhcF (GntR family)